MLAHRRERTSGPSINYRNDVQSVTIASEPQRPLGRQIRALRRPLAIDAEAAGPAAMTDAPTRRSDRAD